MSWATKKKITYLSIVFSAVIIFFAIILFPTLYRPPSCFDNKQNQGEGGVDCGGPCQLLCKSQTAKPLVLWQRFFKVSDGVYSAVAYVQNSNLNSAAYNVPYVFRLYDAQNSLILERKGATSIAPTAVTPIFEGALVTGTRIPAKVSFSFTADPDWFVWTTRAPKINVSERTDPTPDEKAPSLTARLTNTTFKPIPRFDVVTVLFNANGTAFAASKTVVDGLPEEGTVPIAFSWREPFADTVVKIDIIPKLFPGIHY